jgi:LacI family repressor for deo operon, udp, cdd, tsx, nupC, and nupG
MPPRSGGSPSSWTPSNDIFGSDFCHPPLTTVTSPAEQAGRMLVDMLMGTCAPGRAVLPTPLHVRDSTG